MARSVKISSLAVVLTGRDRGYSRSLNRASRKTSAFTRGVRIAARAMKVGLAFAASTAVVAITLLARSLANATKESFKLLDATAKASDTLGINIGKLLAYQRMAARAGISAEALQKGIQKMVVTISQAAEGMGLGVKALDALGLSAQRLTRMSPDEQLKAIAGAMESVRNSNDRLRISSDIFGLRGATLGRMLSQGREGFEKAERAAVRYNLVVSRVDAARIESANDAIDEMKTAWQGLANTLAVQIAPLITKFFNSVAKDIADITWALNNLGKLTNSPRLATIVGMLRMQAGLSFGPDLRPTPSTTGTVGGAASLFGAPATGAVSLLMQILQRVANIEESQERIAGTWAAIRLDAQRQATAGQLQHFGQPGLLQRRGPIP